MKKTLIAALTLAAAAAATPALAEGENFFSHVSVAERAALGAKGPLIEAPSFATRGFEVSPYQTDVITPRIAGDN